MGKWVSVIIVFLYYSLTFVCIWIFWILKLIFTKIHPPRYKKFLCRSFFLFHIIPGFCHAVLFFNPFKQKLCIVDTLTDVPIPSPSFAHLLPALPFLPHTVVCVLGLRVCPATNLLPFFCPVPPLPALWHCSACPLYPCLWFYNGHWFTSLNILNFLKSDAEEKIVFHDKIELWTEVRVKTTLDQKRKKKSDKFFCGFISL